MDRKLPPSETRYDDLVGVVSVLFKQKDNFNSLCQEIAGYDINQFEAVAFRVFIENKPIVTIYAIDKAHSKSVTEGKLPVRKFKKEIDLQDLFQRFGQINFTLTTGEYDLEDMEVTNK